MVQKNVLAFVTSIAVFLAKCSYGSGDNKFTFLDAQTILFSVQGTIGRDLKLRTPT